MQSYEPLKQHASKVMSHWNNVHPKLWATETTCIQSYEPLKHRACKVMSHWNTVHAKLWVTKTTCMQSYEPLKQHACKVMSHWNSGDHPLGIMNSGFWTPLKPLTQIAMKKTQVVITVALIQPDLCICNEIISLNLPIICMKIFSSNFVFTNSNFTFILIIGM